MFKILIALDIIQSNTWDRPIYYAATVSDDARLGLDDYLQMEGMAYRLVPKKNDGQVTFVNPEILEKQLFTKPDGFSRSYQPGFKFRGMDDPSIFLNDNEIRMMQNYRNSFIRLAIHHLYNTGNNEKVIEALDKMEERLPRATIPIDHRILFDVASIYYEAGAVEKYVELADEVEKIALKNLEENPTDFSSSYNPYRLLLDIYEKTGKYQEAMEVINKIETYLPDDPSVRQLRNRFENMAKRLQETFEDTTQ
ncbi:MAG: hypothetical protein U5K00_10785 [Melioribacteraceae bacterium]|nr:hypothetical protein [Melioribacteraceae bacterium]